MDDMAPEEAKCRKRRRVSFPLSSRSASCCDFKLGESMAALARENRIAPQLIYDGRKAYLACGAAGQARAKVVFRSASQATRRAGRS
jgi:hypothetical protein